MILSSATCSRRTVGVPTTTSCRSLSFPKYCNSAGQDQNIRHWERRPGPTWPARSNPRRDGNSVVRWQRIRPDHILLSFRNHQRTATSSSAVIRGLGDRSGLDHSNVRDHCQSSVELQARSRTSCARSNCVVRVHAPPRLAAPWRRKAPGFAFALCSTFRLSWERSAEGSRAPDVRAPSLTCRQ